MTHIVKDAIDSLVSDVDNITPANVKECLKAFDMQDIFAAYKTYKCLGYGIDSLSAKASINSQLLLGANGKLPVKDAKAELIAEMLSDFRVLQHLSAEYPEDNINRKMRSGNFIRSVYRLRQFLVGDVNIHTNGSRAKASINKDLVYAADNLLNGTKTKEELANWLLAIGKFIMKTPLEDLQGAK